MDDDASIMEVDENSVQSRLTDGADGRGNVTFAEGSLLTAMEEETLEDESMTDDSVDPARKLDPVFENAVKNPTQDAPALQVVLRVRPVSKERETCIDVVSDTCIQTTTPTTSVNYKILGQQVREYCFNRVFGPESTQEEVYKLTTQPLVDALFMGKSGLLFAYGVTNAGKTFTIMGTDESPGLLPRALEEIFTRVLRQGRTTSVLASKRCAVYVSYLEVYNDQIFDLLVDPPTANAKRTVLKLQDRQGRIEVKGIKKEEIKDAEAGLALVRRGAQNRRIAETKLNVDSSRSHSVFTVELIARSTSPEAEMMDDGASVKSRGGDLGECLGTLWIVDLAGSERSKRTGPAMDSKLQREASGINTSLMKLWRCLDQLRRNQQQQGGSQQLVPYRESKITHLFMNHLSGSSVGRTVMILNANPSKEDYDETTHVLTQGSGAQEIRVIKDNRRELRQRQLLCQTHGYDGRRIVRRKKSLDSKAKMKAKVKGSKHKSPKEAPQPGESETTQSDEEDEEELSGVESDTALTRTGRKSLAMREMRDVVEENRVLRETVESLKDRLSQAETEIREEVAEEMAHRMSQLEQQLRSYRESMALMASASSTATSTAAGSTSVLSTASTEARWNARSNGASDSSCAGAPAGRAGQRIQHARREKYVTELESYKQEAEEELVRIRAQHEKELADLKAKLEASAEETLRQVRMEAEAARSDANHWKARALKTKAATTGGDLDSDVSVEDVPAQPAGHARPHGGGTRRPRKRSKSEEGLPQPQLAQAGQQLKQHLSQSALEGVRAAETELPPPLESTAALSDAQQAANDRKLRLQERVRQQLKPKGPQGGQVGVDIPKTVGPEEPQDGAIGAGGGVSAATDKRAVKTGFKNQRG